MRYFKLLSSILFILTLMACQSREEKAAKLIKEEMFKTLYDFSSYEPIETVVDSSFTSIYRDSTILSYAYLINEHLDDVKEYFEKIEDAKSTMEIWAGSYSYYSRSKFNKATEELTSNLGKANELLSKIREIQQQIKERSKYFNPTFCGWQASHKFRCKTKGGNFELPNYLYVFDPDFKKIIYQENLADEERQQLKNIIDESLEVDSSPDDV